MTKIRISGRLKFSILERRSNDETIKLVLMRSTFAGYVELITSAKFHLISAVDVCNLASWSYCSGLEAAVTATHDLPLDRGKEKGMWRAYIFMPSLRRTRYSCLRLIRWSKVVSYGKPRKDLLILDGRVRQRLIPFPILSAITAWLWPLFHQKNRPTFFVSTRTIEI